MKGSSLSVRTALAIVFLCISEAASAVPVTFTLTTSGGALIDAFSLDSAAGRADGVGTPPYVLFDLTSDADGYNALFFGDGSTGGVLGIGNIILGDVVDTVILEGFTPPFYADDGTNVNLANGVYVAGSGDILTISGLPEATVPEPETLPLIGLSLLALFGLRWRHRRQA